MATYLEYERIREQMKDICLNSGCTCTFNDICRMIDNPSEIAITDLRAEYCRAMGYAVGEYLANYYETPKNDRIENRQQYVEWLLEETNKLGRD